MGGLVNQPPIQDDDLYIIDDENCPLIDQLDGNISVTSTLTDPLEQLFGNMSFSSVSSFSSNFKDNKSIPVQVGHRPRISIPQQRLPHARRTVRRDNKVLQAVTLPKMSSYNMRSLMPKVSNFGIDMDDRNCSLSFLTEIWEKSENKKHQYKIEELFELKS